MIAADRLMIKEFPMRPDGRVRPQMGPPGPKSKTVVAQLTEADYRLLYELTLTSGVSMAETLRQLIREAAKKLPHA
ncbi:MAG: hypothetical protein JNK19_03030 [Tabrizicola sp.]|nr:hypothetical protein [Tabrizicola sp.]